MGPLFSAKGEILDYLQEKANEGKIAYNAIRNGPWFDIGELKLADIVFWPECGMLSTRDPTAIQVTIGFDLKERKATLYEGNRKFHTTTRTSVSAAIVNILRNPSKFANKVLHIHDFFITQSELLEVAESVTSEKFATEEVSVEALGAKSMEAIMKGEFTQQHALNVLKRSIWSENGSARWDSNDDSAALGLGGVSLREEVEKLVKASK